MDDDESADDFELLEEELLRWIQELYEGDDVMYAAARASTKKLADLNAEVAMLRARLLTGGRKRKKQRRTHEEHHARLIDDWFGTDDVTIDGVLHEGKEPWFEESSFNRRYRMGPKLFCRLLYEIRDPVTGHIQFHIGPDAMGEAGASALQKLTAVVRIMAYGLAFDAVHEYTGVREAVAGKCFTAFVTGLTHDMVAFSLEFGPHRRSRKSWQLMLPEDSQECSGALIARTGTGRTAPCLGKGSFRIGTGTGRLLQKQ